MLQDFAGRVKTKLRLALAHGSVSLRPRGTPVGNVLLSYLIEPFLRGLDNPVTSANSQHWECRQMAQTFLDLGYRVDVISWENRRFAPRRRYAVCVDIHHNLERLAPLLPDDCIKVLHITGAHWLFQNQAEYARLLALQQRRGVTLPPRRTVPPSRGIECCDRATILGNGFTAGTFAYARKPLHAIPLSSSVVAPWPQQKDFAACSHRFLWLGNAGMVHKGLDLVLEAFAQMPEQHLTVCGPAQGEPEFEDAFRHELYRLPNIRTVGWINIGSSEWPQVANSCAGLIYPSCSEGQAGSVVTSLHAGLIPIVSRESGVDVNGFGVPLETCSVDEIKAAIRAVSALDARELERRSRAAWEYAATHHTRENFARCYRDFALDVLQAGKQTGKET